MFETIFIFMLTFSVLVGATKGIVVPVAEKTVEVTTEVVEQAIDYVTTEEPEE